MVSDFNDFTAISVTGGCLPLRCVLLMVTSAHLKQATERELLHHGGAPGLWGNLGLWPAGAYASAAQQLADAVLGAAQLRSGQRLVMCGCGTGAEMQHAISAYRLVAAVGIEQDAALATVARSMLAQSLVRPTAFADDDADADADANWSDQSPVAVLTGNACQLDQCLRYADLPASDSWDAVVAVDSAYHFSPRQTWLRASWQALRPGGCIAYTDLVVAPDTSKHSLVARSVWPSLAGRAAGIDATGLMSADAARQRLAETGFVETAHVDLSAAVLDGFARFVQEQSARLAHDSGLQLAAPWLVAARLSAWRRVAATASLIRLGRRQGLSYGLFSARKPLGSGGGQG